MKPRIEMTSPAGWDFNYLKRVIESVELENPVVTTGRTFMGKYKLTVTWDEEKSNGD